MSVYHVVFVNGAKELIGSTSEVLSRRQIESDKIRVGPTVIGGAKMNVIDSIPAIFVWDVGTGEVKHKFLKSHGPLAISPDGKTLACAREFDLELWDLATKKRTACLQGHQKAVTTIAFSPDGKTLASGSYDRTIRLWDVAGAKQRAVLEGKIEMQGHVPLQPETVRSVAFSPDGKWLASGAHHVNVKLWDVTAAKELEPLGMGLRKVRVVQFSPNGKLLAVGDGGRLQFWDWRAHKMLNKITENQGGMNCLAFSPDGKLVATGGHDRTVKIWKVPSK
jgi:WD40 repeat protein